MKSNCPFLFLIYIHKTKLQCTITHLFKPFRPYLIEKKINAKHSIKNKMTWKFFLGAEFGRSYQYTSFENRLDASLLLRKSKSNYTRNLNEKNNGNKTFWKPTKLFLLDRVTSTNKMTLMVKKRLFLVTMILL